MVTCDYQGCVQGLECDDVTLSDEDRGQFSLLIALHFEWLGPWSHCNTKDGHNNNIIVHARICIKYSRPLEWCDAPEMQWYSFPFLYKCVDWDPLIDEHVNAD